jgi:hypothetical protein
MGGASAVVTCSVALNHDYHLAARRIRFWHPTGGSRQSCRARSGRRLGHGSTDVEPPTMRTRPAVGVALSCGGRLHGTRRRPLPSGAVLGDDGCDSVPRTVAVNFSVAALTDGGCGMMMVGRHHEGGRWHDAGSVMCVGVRLSRRRARSRRGLQQHTSLVECASQVTTFFAPLKEITT